jgi:hypothetical protein
MILKHYQFTTTLILTTLFVGTYQLPLIENTLIKYGINNSINDIFPYSKVSQQYIEDLKISFSANLNTKKEIVINKPLKNDIILNTKDSLPLPPVNNKDIPPLVLKKELCQINCKVLMIGDSVMGDVDFSLQRLLKKEHPSWEVVDAHKVSSGLTNQTYYNWPQTAQKLLEQYNPDYTFVLIGTNDAQNMLANGHGLSFGKELWINEYKERVSFITNLLKEKKTNWFWIELPVVRDVSFNSKLEVIRNIQKKTTDTQYLSVEPLFGKSDHSEVVNMKLRAGDGIHLNSNGANLIANSLLSKLKINE